MSPFSQVSSAIHYHSSLVLSQINHQALWTRLGSSYVLMLAPYRVGPNLSYILHLSQILGTIGVKSVHNPRQISSLCSVLSRCVAKLRNGSCIRSTLNIITSQPPSRQKFQMFSHTGTIIIDLYISNKQFVWGSYSWLNLLWRPATTGHYSLAYKKTLND